MNAKSTIRLLREAQENDPLDIGPLDRYTGPIEFERDVRDILDQALFLKQQAENAGALNPGVIGNYPVKTIHRALLRIACEELDDEKQVNVVTQRLRRVMHSLWD